MLNSSAGEAINLAFKMSEQKVTAGLIKPKFKVANAYWGKVDDSGMFPKNSGTTIKGIRLGRIGVSNEHGWDNVSDSLCETNLCADNVPEVLHNGFDEYYFSIIRRSIRTDWLCINALALREMPAEELQHFEAGIRDAARYLWDEVYRSRYIDFSQNKMLCLIDQAVLDGAVDNQVLTKSCVPDIRSEGFIFERRLKDDGTEGEMDERYIRVNCPASQINRISEMSLDLLDEAAQYLEYEDENMPFLSEGVDLFDVVLAHNKMDTRFAENEDSQMGGAHSLGGYDSQLLKRTLGTKRVWRNRYSTRYDQHAMRFYPDTDYNTNTLPSAGAYSPINPTTWPRFKRVFAYIPVQAGVAGIKYVFNPAYRYAPFGISTIFTPKVIKGLQFPDINGVGGAKKAGIGTQLGYAGTATWVNPDWESNVNREFGFWKLRFGIGIKPSRPEFGYAYLHRIDHRIALSGITCGITPAPGESEVSPYCGPNTGGSIGDPEYISVDGGFNGSIQTFGGYV